MASLLEKIDSKIRRAFSKAAVDYDLLTSLHKEIAREFVEKIKLENPQAILDVGMGTGYLTNKLVNLFPEAKVTGLDFALGMVEQAKKNSEGFEVIEADACQLPFTGEIFDAVTSNLAYQWIEDLPQAFAEAFRVLKRGGLFCFTLFGHDTLKELFSSLNNICDEKPIQLRRLASADQVKEALRKAGFQDVNVTVEHIQVHFDSVTELLKWLKAIGANRLAEEIPVGKDWLKKLEQEYRKHYSDRFGISSTFEVVWVEAIK